MACLTLSDASASLLGTGVEDSKVKGCYCQYIYFWFPGSLTPMAWRKLQGKLVATDGSGQCC